MSADDAPEPRSPEGLQPERLQKVLARAGFGSRRACDELVAEGRVHVNGRIAQPGARVRAGVDTIQVDGAIVELDDDLAYYALNKPEGYVVTKSDPRGRPTVMGFVPSSPRVFPVGRLDIDTTGLLLLTNDGAFAEHVAHPRYEIPKRYLAAVRGHASRRHVAALRRGVDLDDGPAAADLVTVLGTNQGRSLVELTVHSGRHRMVRRMLKEVGLPVLSLSRTAIGPVELGRLKPGTYRNLSREEVRALRGEGAPRTLTGS